MQPASGVHLQHQLEGMANGKSHENKKQPLQQVERAPVLSGAVGPSAPSQKGAQLFHAIAIFSNPMS